MQPKAGERANLRETVASVLSDLAERPSAKVREEPRLEALSSIVQSAQPAFDLLDRATPLDFQRFSPDLPAHSQLSADLLQLAAVNSLRTDVQTLRGEYANAARSHVASLRLQRTLPGAVGPFLPRTTGSLRLLLSHAALDDQSLQALQRAYQEVAKDDGVAGSLIDQRALLLESIWPHATGRPSWAQRLDGRGIGVGRRMSETAFLVLRPWLTHRLVEGLAVLQQRIDLARLPWSQKFSAAQALGQGVPDPARDPAGSESQSVGLTTPFPSLTTQGVPPFVRTVVAGGEQLALNRVMLAVLAVERYRRAHHETLPPSLDATVSDYLDRVPTDPFDGAPLRYADRRRLASTASDRMRATMEEIRGSGCRTSDRPGQMPLRRAIEASAYRSTPFSRPLACLTKS